MNKINFTKMHGLGNDFVIIDNRSQIFIKNSGVIKKICNRKEGIGCDQLILIEECQDKLADVKIRIFNSDGSEVETCGNATRCVGKIILEGKKLPRNQNQHLMKVSISVQQQRILKSNYYLI